MEFLHDPLSWSEFQCGDQSTWVDLLNCQAGCLWHVAWNATPTQWMPEISIYHIYPRLKVNSWAFSVTANWIPSLGSQNIQKRSKKKLDLVSLKILILMILSRLSRYRISRSEYRTTSIALWKRDQFSKYRKGPSARNYSTLQLLRILRIRRLAFLFNIDLFFLPYQACCAATDMEMPWNAIIWGGPCNDEWANVASCQLRAFPIVPENQKITDAYDCHDPTLPHPLMSTHTHTHVHTACQTRKTWQQFRGVTWCHTTVAKVSAWNSASYICRSSLSVDSPNSISFPDHLKQRLAR